MRLAYFGGFSKHKGVHLLLDAFARSGVRAELALYGGGSDADYVERLRRRAEEVGARWGGAYARAELPGLLARVDAVVVPSIWVENYPLVIREAFSARRPVLASRLGAIPESVRDDVDGLLFEPGDVEDLARVLRRVADEPGLLERLARGIPRVKSIDEEAAELVEHYRAAIAARPRSDARELPRSLAAFVERYRALARLEDRELLRRSLSGIERLRAHLAGELGPEGEAGAWGDALAADSRARTLVRDLRRENEWLRERLAAAAQAWREPPTLSQSEQQLEQALRSFEAQAGVLRTAEPERTFDERESRLAELEAEFRDTAALALEALRAQARLSGEELAPILRRVAELSSEDPSQLELPDPRAGLAEHLRAFGERIRALETLRRELVWRRELVTKLEGEARWRREQMERLDGEVQRLQGALDQLGRRIAAADAAGAAEPTAGAHAGLDARLERLIRELEWRRREMRELAREPEGFAARLFGGGARARRIAGWDERQEDA